MLTDRIKSAAVKTGGGGVLVCCWVFVVDCPPCGDGSCDVEAMSPTATHVEHDLLKNYKPRENSILIQYVHSLYYKSQMTYLST